MPNGGDPKRIKAKVEALQLSIEGLIKLLGSNDPNKRLEYWEKLKGITTPNEVLLVEQQLTATNQLVTQAEASIKALGDAARQIGGAAKTAAH
ncbi:MAG: hypothetical protein ACRD5Z_18180 [Bryobacteraceae bacterium]